MQRGDVYPNQPVNLRHRVHHTPISAYDLKVAFRDHISKITHTLPCDAKRAGEGRRSAQQVGVPSTSLLYGRRDDFIFSLFGLACSLTDTA